MESLFGKSCLSPESWKGYGYEFEVCRPFTLICPGAEIDIVVISMIQLSKMTEDLVRIIFRASTVFYKSPGTIKTNVNFLETLLL